MKLDEHRFTALSNQPGFPRRKGPNNGTRGKWLHLYNPDEVKEWLSLNVPDHPFITPDWIYIEHTPQYAGRSRNTVKKWCKCGIIDQLPDGRVHIGQVMLIGRAIQEWREERRATAKERNKQWRRENRHLARAWDSKRRAKKKGIPIGAERDIKAFMKEARQGRKKCYWCKRYVPTDQRHVDHIIPLDKNGHHDVNNLCVSCSRCNVAKRAKDPFEFAGQGELGFASSYDHAKESEQQQQALDRRQALLRYNAWLRRIASNAWRHIRHGHPVVLTWNDAAFIPLGRGQHALVDQSDVQSVLEKRWCVQFKGNYKRACSSGRNRQLLNRFITGVNGEHQVRHRNGDQLDYRRANLDVRTIKGNKKVLLEIQ